jgi:hypothetical protein
MNLFDYVFYLCMIIVLVYFISELLIVKKPVKVSESFFGLSDSNNNDVPASSHLKGIKPVIYSVNNKNESHKYQLRDYYIYSSYSTPNVGDFKNTNVSIDQIKELIRLGVRVIDLEVFTVDSKPVFAASNSKNVYEKKSYNHLEVADTLQTIRNFAFSSGTCNNYDDPLIIHYRLRTKNRDSIDTLAKITNEIMGTKLLGHQHGFENHRKSLGAVPLLKLRGKCIIATTKADDSYNGSKLYEITNMVQGSPFFRTSPNKEIVYAPNLKDLINTNKKNMCFSHPEPEEKNSTNVNVIAHQASGVHMIGVNFQKDDVQLRKYMDYFNNKHTAFVLKPEPMRYVPIVIPDPVPQKKELSYARKPLAGPGFKLEI